ncbi:DUF3365 domain-containing protein [Opitutus sp. ER46]|uniref:c-type heme family protein n=1 Tax=Opitutus sp. ER46 TaxID=2161864 RepID=UPI000D2F8052|nr:DUF3365 domain-containing protein [Opitutus sp. ER46]PTX91487.1 hypothetical protein DB354_16490 [Opitutus sp. ER46]
MQKHPRFVMAAALAAVFVGCPLRAQEAPAAVEAEFVDPYDPEARSYVSAGSYAIDRLAMTMITDAAAAVSRGTEVAALPTCHLKDVPMKNGTVGGLPRITALKLTSLKLRNPANAPDAAEAEALKKVHYALMGGVPPKLLVQRIKQASGAYEWRVYKPLATIRQCGSCHAKAEEQSAELRAALQQKYNNDDSNSYGPGEWRGLIRVTVADAAAPAATPAPAATEAPKPGSPASPVKVKRR